MQKIIRGRAVDLSSEGKGVVKYRNDIVFVDGLFPDEDADIEILYQRAGVYYGKVNDEELIDPLIVPLKVLKVNNNTESNN